MTWLRELFRKIGKAMGLEQKLMNASKPLKDVINGLREELSELNEESSEEALRFEVGEVEVALQVAITAEGGGKLGFKCFYEVEAGAKVERATTHTLKLKLTPTLAVGSNAGDPDDDPSEESSDTAEIGERRGKVLVESEVTRKQ